MTKVELYHIKSKKTGQDVPCLRVIVGVYETLVFPSKAELEYVKNYIRSNARDEFQDEVESNED